MDYQDRIRHSVRRHLWWLKEGKQELERWKFLARQARNDWRPAKGNRPNVLLLSVDSMAAGHLACYGYHCPTSPTMDRLAQSGILFENVIAQTNWTKPALASMLTSLYPSVHKTDSRGEAGDRTDVQPRQQANVLDDRFRTLAQEFKDGGYVTAGISNGGYAHSFFGFDRGFDFYSNQGGGLKSCAYQFLTWVLRNPGAPFFGFIHCWDAHFPYLDRAPYNQRFVKRRSKIVLDADTRSKINNREMALTDEEREFLKGLFDGAINYVDHQIAGIVQELKRLGLDRNTILVITADHGEAFMEHGVVEHTACLYNEVLRIPLILSGPGLSRGKRIPAQVRSIDIMPTLLDLCGVTPTSEIQGASLLPWITDARRDHLAAGSETQRTGGQKAYSDGHHKIIRKHAHQVEVYDLVADPEEKYNIATANPRLCSAMEAQLRAWEHNSSELAARYWSDNGEEQSTEMAPEVVERLRDLGYI